MSLMVTVNILLYKGFREEKLPLSGGASLEGGFVCSFGSSFFDPLASDCTPLASSLLGDGIGGCALSHHTQ